MTSRSLRSRIVLGIGALSTACALGFAGFGGTSLTDAAWSDEENARGQVRANWPTAYATIVAMSAKSSTPAINSGNLTYDERFRFSMRTEGTEQILGYADRPYSKVNSSPPRVTRDLDSTWVGTGNRVNDTGFSTLAASNNADTGPGVDNGYFELHNALGAEVIDPYRQLAPGVKRCLAINPGYKETTAGDPSYCGFGPGTFAAATNTTEGYGFSISGGFASNTFVNARSAVTGVRCGISDAYAMQPQGRIDIGHEFGTALHMFLNYTGSYSSRWQSVWDTYGTSSRYDPNFHVVNRVSEKWNSAGLNGHVRTMPVVKAQASAPGTAPYALSEAGLYVEYYFGANAATPQVKMYFVLSRSECGVKRGIDAALPAQAPTLPTDLPGGNGLSPAPAAYTPQARLLREPAPKTSSETTGTSPATTTTSPTESSTASTVTTSAPPPDTTSDESTTPEETTTTASVPAEPEPLDTDDQIVLVGNVTIDDAFEDAWVKGNTEPDDADAGVGVIDTWINSGIQTDRDWEVFESDNPAADGWHYAAISQLTGTVVYIK